ncbi:hypothetical protein HYQ46_008343 [Verticillium longisporum]|nr:hypothetical protein HYQ46_008343 [Verticillium longisporum]
MPGPQAPQIAKRLVMRQRPAIDGKVGGLVEIAEEGRAAGLFAWSSGSRRVLFVAEVADAHGLRLVRVLH